MPVTNQQAYSEISENDANESPMREKMAKNTTGDTSVCVPLGPKAPSHAKLSSVHAAGLTCTDGVRHQRRYIRPKREVHARCQRRLLSGPFSVEHRRIALLPLLPLPSLSQLRRSQSGKDARQVALWAMGALRRQMWYYAIWQWAGSCYSRSHTALALTLAAATLT